jgi:hypothetical protein
MLRIRTLVVFFFITLVLISCATTTIQTEPMVQTPITILPTHTGTPSATPIQWEIGATALDLPSDQATPWVEILDQMHPGLCIKEGYDIVTLTPEPIEMHVPKLVFEEIDGLPDPRPRYDNIRADNMDHSFSAYAGCQPGDCSKLYIVENSTGKVFDINFGGMFDRPVDWLQWLDKDTVTFTQMGHVWIVISVINIQTKEFEYYGYIHECFPTPTP